MAESQACSDEDLARRVQEGDIQAMEALVERYLDPLLGYLYRLLYGDRPLAEDLAQEVFLRAFTRIDTYAYPRPFKPWLYIIATNLARNHYTAADTRRVVDPGQEDEQYADSRSADGLLSMLEEAEELERAVSALNRLPDGQREAILLRYFEDLSLAQIGGMLGIPEGTVKSRLSIGLGRLRALLVEGEHNHGQ